MDNVIYLVIQGCVAYEPVDPVTWPFLTETAARKWFEEVRLQRYVGGPAYEGFYTELHRVPEGEQVCGETDITPA